MATIAADLEVRDADVVAGGDLMRLGDTEEGPEVRLGQGHGDGSGRASRFEDGRSGDHGDLGCRCGQQWESEAKQEDDESSFYGGLLQEKRNYTLP